MNHELLAEADDYFRTQVGAGLGDLVAPIDDGAPAGTPPRGEGLDQRVRALRARERHPLEAAAAPGANDDWRGVSLELAETLCRRCKDLRVVAWLLEARLHTDGLAAFAPCAILLAALCEEYWDTVHPLMADGDPAYRTNVFDWLDGEAATLLRREPLTATSGSEPDYTLADWERAVREEQSRAREEDGDTYAVREEETATIAGAFARTPTTALQATLRRVDAGQAALQWLGAVLAETEARDAGRFPRLREALGDLGALLGSELERRGDARQPGSAAAAAGQDRAGEGGDGGGAAPAEPGWPLLTPPTIQSRADAYACLAMAAQFLARAEPHSPVPYLVDRAVYWGRLNAADLYRVLFLEGGGQLNVFELMGLAAPPERGDEA
jgi:type VI secretion system ImpA family protein